MSTTASVIALSTPRAAEAVAAYTELLGPGIPDGRAHYWHTGSTMLVVTEGDPDARVLVPAAELVRGAAAEEAVTLLKRRAIPTAPAEPIGGAAVHTAADLPIGVIDTAALDTAALDTAALDPGAGGPATESAPGPSEVTRLDHIVMSAPSRDGALALFGAGLGFDFRLEQRFTPARGGEAVHQLFLRGAGSVVEILVSPQAPRIDLWGLAWTSADPDATHARLTDRGADLSEIRRGHKPGTRVFTIRGDDLVLPTIVIGHD
ncbi:VOC family protein [Gordonia crocea]|uniref:VOC family protein n=1 Tax=Gordonia crocea TaxID=589162 RepID=UPI001379ACC7|nr:VOC family protein [Gordonia crocea]